MTKTNFSLQRLVWAIDPFAEDTDLVEKIGRTLALFASGKKVEIEPVSILIADDPAHPDPIKRRAEAARHLAGLLGRVDLKTRSPLMLEQKDLSLAGAVAQVLRHADSTEADLIVVGTQSKVDASRFMLGSFAELLILHSTIPVLVLSPRTKGMVRIGRLLFPTDLTDGTQEAFDHVLDLAKETRAGVTVFYASPSSARESDDRRDCEKLIERALSAGVEADLQFQKAVDSTSEAILNLSSRLTCPIVCMVSHGSHRNTTVLGNLTKHVLQHATSPVWVLYSNPLKG